MLVWIDAAHPAARLQVFGLTVTERHLQALMRLEPKPTQVIIDVGSKDPGALRIPARVLKSLPIVSSQSSAPFAERLQAALRLAGDAPLLVLDGTSLADQRLHGQLIRAEHNLAVFAPDAKESAAMLFLRMAGSVAVPEDATDVTAFGRGLVKAGIAQELTQGQFDGFIRKLRRTVPFYMFRILDQTKAADIQRFMFWSNYKGSTDIFTRYVYPPLVWLMVRPLARARIHPNLVTLVSIALTFGAVPFFAERQLAGRVPDGVRDERAGFGRRQAGAPHLHGFAPRQLPGSRPGHGPSADLVRRLGLWPRAGRARAGPRRSAGRPSRSWCSMCSTG